MSYATSPVSLFAFMLSLIGGVVVLRGINRRTVRQSEALLTELRSMRKTQRVRCSPKALVK